MVTLLKKLMVLSTFILGVGSALTMESPTQQPTQTRRLVPVQRQASLAQSQQGKEPNLTDAVKIFNDTKKENADLKEKLQKTEVLLKEALGESSDEQAVHGNLYHCYKTFRAVAVGVGTLWRIQRYVARFTHKENLLENGSGFALGCCAAAAAVAGADYFMPRVGGGLIIGAGIMDYLNNGLSSAASLISPRLAVSLL